MAKWRPEGWKNPYKEAREIYEEGADAILEALKQQDGDFVEKIIRVDALTVVVKFNAHFTAFKTVKIVCIPGDENIEEA